MQTDKSGRRLRHARPQPMGRALSLLERDFLLLEALQRHGPLPTNYLYELTKHVATSRTVLQHRLTKLYNGTANCDPFVSRPPQQFASFNARCQPLIYDLTPRGLRLLAEHGRRSPYIWTRTGPFVHRLMGACVSASLQLAAKRRGCRYVTKEEIFSHASCPEETRNSASPIALPLPGERTLVPDDLFGIEYPGPKPSYRFFAVEVDRHTESIERRHPAQTAFGRKLKAYIQIMKRSAHVRHWGVPNLMVLTITTNATHLENMLSYLRRLNEPTYAKRFLFKAKPEFGSNWKVPGILVDLIIEPWVGDRGAVDIAVP